MRRVPDAPVEVGTAARLVPAGLWCEGRERVERPGRVIELDDVNDHLAAARGGGQDDERVRIRDEPDLADRAVGRIRGERIEARERLHALDEADTALHPPGELPDMGALATDDPAVVAVEEADQLDSTVRGLGDDLVRCHRRSSILSWGQDC